ncbi:MAG: hypothetical protein ACYSWW_16415 [Planctomycetota bacterium]|jgi:hypothetical protein
MKKMLITLAVLMVVGMVVETAIAGNGAPSGAHYNLNLIGMKKQKNENIGCGEGHRIFVKLGEPKKNGGVPAQTTRIYLTEAPDDETFAVLDCDGTDGEAAFMLPNPAPDPEDPTMENCTAYSVYVRALGNPKGSAVMTTCATDPLTGEEVCSVETVELQHTKGKAAKFVNVSKELLTICALVCTVVEEDVCIAWEWKRLYLFDPLLEDYLWKYDNNGLKLCQMRFYLEPTCDLDLTCPPTP